MFRKIVLLSFVLFHVSSFAQSEEIKQKLGEIPNIAIDARKASMPLSFALEPRGKSVIKTIELPEMALNVLRQKSFDKSGGNIEKALDFALPYQIQQNLVDVASAQTVLKNDISQVIYRLKVASSNALSLNFGFSEFHLPKSAKLFIYSSDGRKLFGPITHKDNDQHGQYWTPVIASGDAIIELNVAEHELASVKLKLSSANQAYFDLFNLEKEFATLKSGSCNVDVVCSQGNGWRAQINSVAMYSLNGSRVCSGAAINSSGNFARRFLTAHHCNVTQSSAATMVVYWNFENSYCRSPNTADSSGVGDGVTKYFNSGAQLLASYATTDMILVQLDDPIPFNANAYLAGWNRTFLMPTSSVAIHHPSLLEKRISFDFDAASVDSITGSSGSHIRVNDWDIGTTEPGSSGSPLFDQNGLIVGQLHGGSAACGNNLEDYYGRLATSWNGGGSSSNRLRDWLDPINSGAVSLIGRYHNAQFQADAFEPNNTTSAYTLLTLDADAQQHSLHNPDDIDWFAFVLTEETTVDVVTDSREGDTFMILFDSTGNEIQRDDDSGSNLSASINSLTLQAGVYFVGVIGINVLGETEAVASYSMQVRTSVGCDFLTIPIKATNKAITICL